MCFYTTITDIVHLAEKVSHVTKASLLVKLCIFATKNV